VNPGSGFFVAGVRPAGPMCSPGLHGNGQEPGFPEIVGGAELAEAVGGAAGLALVDSPRLKGGARPAILGLAIVLMVVPARLGSGVQQMWAMPAMSPVRLPLSLLRVAEYVHDHGGPDDVFQDSEFDRIYAVAALAERRTFVAHTLTRMPFRGELIETRTNAIDHFMGLRRAHAVVATARTLGFRWFLLEPGDQVDWPAEIVNKPAFETGPFRLYEF